MPIRCVVCRARRVVLTTWSGYVTVDEIVQNAKRLCVDPDFDSTFSELIDLRDFSGTNATAADLSYFSEEDDPFSLGARRAMFASSELAFGIARMYEILRGETEEFAVFHTLEEACQWLGVAQWAPLLAELALLDKWEKDYTNGFLRREEIDSRKARQQRRKEIMEQIQRLDRSA
ncbi:MAG TPA: hypothetical protein VEV41_07360 [Terriglobales bacterium]|nr:hypothetical protein [Terriglobales bacterium]